MNNTEKSPASDQLSEGKIPVLDPYSNPIDPSLPSEKYEDQDNVTNADHDEELSLLRSMKDYLNAKDKSHDITVEEPNIKSDSCIEEPTNVNLSNNVEKFPVIQRVQSEEHQMTVLDPHLELKTYALPSEENVDHEILKNTETDLKIDLHCPT